MIMVFTIMKLKLKKKYNAQLLSAHCETQILRDYKARLWSAQLFFTAVISRPFCNKNKYVYEKRYMLVNLIF